VPPATIVPRTAPTAAAVSPTGRAAGGLRAFVRATRLLSVALVAVSAVVAFAPRDHADRAEAATAAPAPASPAGAPEITDATTLLAAINAARAGKGLGPLQSDPVLDAGAQQWADDMAAHASVSHDPQLTAAYSDDWRRMAENVSTGASLGELHGASLRGSRATILDPDATLVGVGIAVAPRAVYLVERTVS
jgi:uncharacterized protein YkwD